MNESLTWSNKSSTTVAGVTFANPDGESRQEIIKQILNKQIFHTAILKETTFENERAVEVWIENKQIGYIPRKELSNAISYFRELTAFLMYSKEHDTYHVTLYAPLPCSDYEQKRMRNICSQLKTSQPINDQRAYNLFYYQHNIDPFVGSDM